MIKEAFGPTFKTVEIEKPLGKLICKEQYTADMADVFYDVNFKLINMKMDTIYLGNGSQFETLASLIKNELIDKNEIRFYYPLC